MQEIATNPRDSVETPKYILDYVRQNWGGFFDPCPLNLHPLVDGLTIDWGNVNYVNPPYSQAKRWVEKSYREYMLGKTVVLFVKVGILARGYFQKINTDCELKFLKRRVRFPGFVNRAQFDSVFIIFKPNNPQSGTFSWANI